MGKERMKIIDINASAEWDKIVKSFDQYDVYNLSGYSKSFKIHGDGEPKLLYYEDDNIRGFNVVMKRDIADDPHFEGKIPKGKWFDLVTPYGYGGWIIEGSGDKTPLFEEYKKLCRDSNIICEFVRFHPVLNNYKYVEDLYQTEKLGHTIAMDITSPDVIWSNLTSKNRNMIRKAEKSNIEIVVGNDEDSYRDFRQMYDETMVKNGADEYYFFDEKYYDGLRTDLADNALVFSAIYNGINISSAIVTFANGRLNYHLSGSVYEYRNLAPSNLLLYRAAVWGSEHGMKTFHLGGGIGSQEDNLFKFKKAFYRGELKQFVIGKIIFDKEVYDTLCEMRKGDAESSFFPEYRRP